MGLKTRRNRKSLALSLHPGCLVIKDNEQQLTAEDIQHLGQRFWRKSAPQHGHGLGLTLTANLLKQYGYLLSFNARRPYGLRIEIKCGVSKRDLQA